MARLGFAMIWLALSSVTLGHAGSLAQPAAAAPAVADPRAAFDFLLGTWVPQSASGNAVAGSGQSYKFSKAADTPVIIGDWVFDRGTPGKPDMAHSKYYSGYNNDTASWSFYYVSERSAQAWPGTLRNGTWYFDHDFTVNEATFHQRQWWEPVDSNTVRRHIENSAISGKAPESAVITFKRVDAQSH